MVNVPWKKIAESKCSSDYWLLCGVTWRLKAKDCILFATEMTNLVVAKYKFCLSLSQAS